MLLKFLENGLLIKLIYFKRKLVLQKKLAFIYCDDLSYHVKNVCVTKIFCLSQANGEFYGHPFYLSFQAAEAYHQYVLNTEEKGIADRLAKISPSSRKCMFKVLDRSIRSFPRGRMKAALRIYEELIRNVVS